MNENDREHVSDAAWLVSAEAETLLKEKKLAELDAFHRLTWLREKAGISPERAGLVANLWELRRRGAEKFPRSDAMFFTPVGLEQATDAFLAEYKAKRFPEGVPVADLCCGIGGDLLALAARGPVLGVDRDTFTATMAAENVRRWGDGTVENISVEDFLQKYPPERFPCLHIDPDRRPEGIRSTQTAFFAPGPEVLERCFQQRRQVAVKLAPGTEVPDAWEKYGMEREWLGRDRECRQLVVWLGVPQGGVRATLVSRRSSDVLRTLAGRPNQEIPVAERPGKYLFDVDSTLLAANLEGALAAEHGLRRLFSAGVYLTGDTPITNDAALACFEILERLPLDRKKLIRAVAQREWGSVEIKKRGDVPLPEDIRKMLKLSKKSRDSGVLFVTRTSEGTVVIVARRKNNG
ncbi:MAG: hypothetical protein Q4D98_04830 [Planctomycetia bacterium]|nr:hypothetical protein [Planctomycetia bacterium]